MMPKEDREDSTGGTEQSAQQLARLAHELNQPLAAIAAYAAAMRMRIEAGSAADTLRTPLEGIAQEARRAGELVRRLRSEVLPSLQQRPPSRGTEPTGEAP